MLGSQNSHTQEENKTQITNSQESSIQALHTDIERSTAQYTFKSIGAGLTRQINEPKNEEKDSNSSSTSSFTSVKFSCLAHASNTT